MRILGLDIGTRRIGVAISDEMGWTGQPLEYVRVRRDGGHFEQIEAICEQYGVTEIVAGLPINMDGTMGRAVRRVRGVIEQVEETTGLPVHEWDERLTTAQADRIVTEADLSRKRRREVIDKLSAAIILQSYLRARSHERDRDEEQTRER